MRRSSVVQLVVMLVGNNLTETITKISEPKLLTRNNVTSTIQ